MRTLGSIKRKRRRRAASLVRNMDEHQAQRKAFYRSSTWKALRHQQLIRESWCRECRKQGRKTIATVVDHIEPWRGNGMLAVDPSNLQSMCPSCHNAKTQNELRELGQHPLQ